MGEQRVSTYEATGGGIRVVGSHDSMAASSAALPDGAYTTFRTYDGRRVLRLDRHFRRLDESIALEGAHGKLDPRAARAAIGAALDAAGWTESRLRLTFAPPRLFVAVEAFQPLPRELYETGVACVTVELRRDNPHAKDTRFIATASAVKGRIPSGVEEALILQDGAVLEGLSSNFFAVMHGALRTEDERVLLGVTRALVLEVAEAVVRVERRALAHGELAQASEAFLTSVSREVLPVVRIDGRAVADGRVGPVTRRIMKDFARLVAREAEPL